MAGTHRGHGRDTEGGEGHTVFTRGWVGVHPGRRNPEGCEETVSSEDTRLRGPRGPRTDFRARVTQTSPPQGRVPLTFQEGAPNASGGLHDPTRRGGAARRDPASVRGQEDAERRARACVRRPRPPGVAGGGELGGSGPGACPEGAPPGSSLPSPRAAGASVTHGKVPEAGRPGWSRSVRPSARRTAASGPRSPPT